MQFKMDTHVRRDGDDPRDSLTRRRWDGVAHLLQDVLGVDFPLPLRKVATLLVQTVLGFNVTRRLVVNGCHNLYAFSCETKQHIIHNACNHSTWKYTMTAHMNEMQRQHRTTYNIIHYKGLLLTPALVVDATNYNTCCVRRKCTWIVSQILFRITKPSGSFAKRYKHPKANKLAPQLKLICRLTRSPLCRSMHW